VKARARHVVELVVQRDDLVRVFIERAAEEGACPMPPKGGDVHVDWGRDASDDPVTISWELTENSPINGRKKTKKG